MNKLKISTQLIALTAVFLVFFFITNGMSIRAFSDAVDSAEQVYTHNLLPIRHLNTVADVYAIDAVNAATQTLMGIQSWDVSRKTLGDARTRVAPALTAFEAGIDSPEEEADLLALEPLKARADAALDKLTALLREDDSGGLATFVSTELFGAIAPLQRHLDAMNDRQSALAESAHNALQAKLHTTVVTLASVLIGALLISATAATYITRTIIRQLGAEPHELKHVADAVGRGELYHAITLRKNDHDSVLKTLVAMRDMLKNVVSGVRGNAEAVAIASAQIAEGNNDLSARTEEQAAALEQTAASMEELGSTVQHNASNAVQATELAHTAAGVAGQGGDVVNQMIATMRGIDDSAKRMAGIINTIEGIAFQTNILALNAAVEAARVGEHGRGFAVVAGEVRSLAQRAAQAAKEISELINTSVDRVSHGTTLVGQAGQSMTDIVASTQHVMTLMNEISVANKEQSVGVAQVGEAVTQMDQTTQQNAALVEQSAAAAQGLREQADELLAAVSVFQLGDRQHAQPPARLRQPARQATPSAAMARSVAKSPGAMAKTLAPRPPATPESRAIPLPLPQAPDTAAEPTSAHPGDSDDWSKF
ncbi:methyl-accepting chemotaxis protein [Alcaligenaceae bacterium B3P038]|nr:methyl-accepting chemotaxis protein [Alcaligenaceae bacterium B3P038]